jgi:hypothetical protein
MVLESSSCASLSVRLPLLFAEWPDASQRAGAGHLRIRPRHSLLNRLALLLVCFIDHIFSFSWPLKHKKRRVRLPHPPGPNVDTAMAPLCIRSPGFCVGLAGMAVSV